MSTRGSGIRQLTPPKLQTIIRNPFVFTQNQWYDVWLLGSGEVAAQCAAGAGSIKRNVRIYSIGLDQGVANETVVMRVIADNVDVTFTQVAVAGTDYFVNTQNSADTDDVFLWTNDAGADKYRAFLTEARNLQIMARKTTAAGANNTTIKVIWAQW